MLILLLLLINSFAVQAMSIKTYNSRYYFIAARRSSSCDASFGNSWRVKMRTRGAVESHARLVTCLRREEFPLYDGKISHLCPVCDFHYTRERNVSARTLSPMRLETTPIIQPSFTLFSKVDLFRLISIFNSLQLICKVN